MNTRIQEGVPFYIEVYVDDKEKYDEQVLLNKVQSNAEIIPGLRISNVYSLGCSQDSIVCQKLEDDLNDLQEHMQKIINKYGNFQEDNLIDKMISECGMKPEDFGHFNEAHAYDIQRLLQNRDEIGIGKNGHYVRNRQEPTETPEE